MPRYKINSFINDKKMGISVLFYNLALFLKSFLTRFPTIYFAIKKEPTWLQFHLIYILFASI